MAETLDQAVLDGLLEMVGGDADFVDELADAFLDDAPRQVAEIERAAAEGAAADIARPAHTIKGSSASFGARQVEAISRSIEEQARAGQVDGLAARLNELERALEDMRTALAEARARRWVAS